MRNLIKNILKEEVKKKYSKPTEKVEKLIYGWLNTLTSGAEMYHNKIYEDRHDFEWCNGGKEIIHVILYFDNDSNVGGDKIKTEKRRFKEGSLWIPKDVVSDLAADIPVRRTYLRYIIEEWFEDTLLEKIQTKMRRNDISIDEFEEHPEKTKVCVPPMTRGEDVTEEEMIDLILKTTLYNRKDLEKKSDEEIEKLYLDKLRDVEIKRLRGK